MFFALNSCWQIDHLHKERSGIHRIAVTSGLDALEDCKGEDWLKIAVWHHPVLRAKAIEDVDFLQLLAVHGFRAVLHGHIHEAEKACYDYDEDRGVHLIGAGTFGASIRQMVPGIPHQYNLLAYDRKKGELTVQSRKKEKRMGAWEPDYRWGKKNDQKPWYKIQVRKPAKSFDVDIEPSPASAPTSPVRQVPDPETSRKTYLAELSNATRNLPWASLDPEQANATCSPAGSGRLGLLDIYTSLDTREIEQPPENEEQVRMHMMMRGQEGQEERRLSAQDMVDRHGRLVLLGDPGSGKSTLVNYLAHVMANALLEKDPAPWMERLEKSGPWSRGPLLPVRVVLKDFAVHVRSRKPVPEKGDASLFLKYLRSVFMESEFSGFWDAFYQGLLSREPEQHYLMLWDGLDEVPSELRTIVVASLEDFCARYPENRYLATCRIYAYIGCEFQLNGFRQATLVPFDTERIEAFIDIWYQRLREMGRFDSGEAEERSERLKNATKREDLAGLAERPLLLTVMAMLHSFRGQLPEDRVELYQWTVDLLLRRWENRLGGEKGLLEALNIPGLKMKGLESSLYEVAFQIHADRNSDAETADISDLALLKILRKRLGDLNKAEIFLDYVKNRAGLLVCHRPETFAFPHRTFQEFMAACHLVEMADPVETARLAADDPGKWRVVFVLAARHAPMGQGISAISHMCSQSPGEAEKRDAASFQKAEIAAEAILEIGVMEARQTEPGRIAHGRVVKWMEKAIRADDILAPKERVSMGNALARLGDPRFDPDFWHLPADPMRGFVEIPAGPFRMGIREEDIAMLEEKFGKITLYSYEYETPAHDVDLSKFYISRYPVTVAQFRAFCLDSGHKVEDEDFKKENTVDNHPVVCVSWHDADAYCRWLTKKLDRPEGTVTLPTEAQWEKAALGLKRTVFPWGEEADENRMNFSDTGIKSTSPAGCFPNGASPFGCEDMAGNVWEWTRSLWGDDLWKPEFRYPYDADDGREDMSGGALRVLRGGSWGGVAGFCRSAYRRGLRPGFRSRYVGFRLACLPLAKKEESKK